MCVAGLLADASLEHEIRQMLRGLRGILGAISAHCGGVLVTVVDTLV